jgi:hypothetical protein
MSGKGDTPRPLSVTPDTYAANYARIQWTEDATAANLRDKHLDEARAVITNAPPMSAEMRERLNKVWADFDAAYPQPDSQ